MYDLSKYCEHAIAEARFVLHSVCRSGQLQSTIYNKGKAKTNATRIRNKLEILNGLNGAAFGLSILQ